MGGTEIYKNIELNGRQWAIKKLDAQLGSYYAQECMSKILPSGLGDQIGVISSNDNKKSFTKLEFLEMQRDFLSVCFEKLPAGNRAVILPEGGYGVVDIEFNAPLVQLLTMNSMTHTLQGFFQGSHLKAIHMALLGLFPQNVPTSSSGNTPQ